MIAATQRRTRITIGSGCGRAVRQEDRDDDDRSAILQGYAWWGQGLIPGGEIDRRIVPGPDFACPNVSG